MLAGPDPLSEILARVRPLPVRRAHPGESLAPGRRDGGGLGELGREAVAVYARPQVAVLATGDELVPVSAVPGPGQIRNSNEAMLIAHLQRMGPNPVSLGVARDDRDALHERIV